MFKRQYITAITKRLIKYSSVSLMLLFIHPLLIFSAPSLNQSSSANTGRSLTMQQTIQFVLKNPNFIAWVKAKLDAAKGRYIESTSWSNPEIGYSRENTENNAKESNEEDYSISQTFDFSGKKGLQRKAAKLLLKASNHNTSYLRTRTIISAQRLFYKALYQKRLINVIQQSLKRLSGLEYILRRREKAGDIAGYHRKRISKEKYLVQARLSTERAQYQKTLTNLAALVNYSEHSLSPVTDVRGELTLLGLSSLGKYLNLLPKRPDLVALKLQSQSEEFKSRAEKRGIIPPITLGLGYKRVDESSQALSTGPTISASISIPLFGRRRGRLLKHNSNAIALKSRYSLQLTKEQGRIKGLWLLSRHQTNIARDFKTRALAEARVLARIAKRSYLRGQFRIFELVDAQRSALEVEIKYLDLLYKAKNTRLKLNALVGTL